MRERDRNASIQWNSSNQNPAHNNTLNRHATWKNRKCWILVRCQNWLSCLSLNKSDLKKTDSMSHTQWWFTQWGINHLYINVKSGKPALNIVLVTFLHQHQFVHRKPNIIPRSIQSVWYQHFGLNMQEVAPTGYKCILWKLNMLFTFFEIKNQFSG